MKLAPAPIPIAYNHTSFQEKFGMLRQKKIVDQYSELVINKKIASWTSYTDQPTAKLPRTSYTCGNPRTMLIIWGVSSGPYWGQGLKHILSMNQRRSLLSIAWVTIVSSGPRPRASRTEQLNCENHTREKHLMLSLVECFAVFLLRQTW